MSGALGDPPDDDDDDGDPKEPPPSSTKGIDGKKPRRPQLMRARIRDVEAMLRGCMTHGTIERMCAKQWDVTPRMVRHYIRAVFRQWEREAKLTAGHQREMRRAQLEGVLERCLECIDPDHRDAEGNYLLKPDLRTATIALHRLCMIDGVYEPLRLEVNGSAVESMKSMDRESELIALIQKYRAQKEAAQERRSKDH